MSKSKAKAKPKAVKVKSVKPKKEKKVLTTKLQSIINLMQRPDGATLEEMMKATDWQKHTVRGAISRAVKQKHGYQIVSDKPKGGERFYKIAASKQ